MIDKSASLLIGVIFVAFLFPLNVLAQSEEQIVEEIVVVGELIGELGLSQPSSAGSRLGLTLLETPATVETISSSIIRARGYQQISDAVASLPGVVSGESPAAPSTFSMRGFTRSQITVLRDGLWVGPANMVMRPQNTFNLDRIEVLRGPSSVLNGQGAVAGTINAISRSAEAEQSQSVDVLASYGRYDSYQLGVGAGGALSDSTWYRVDVSQRESSGYVDRMDPESFNATASVLFQPSEQFSIKLSADYLDDDLADYWGTPLVPTSAARRPMNDVISTRTGETIDARSRFRNYNVADSRAESDQLFLRADLTWMPNERFTLKNTTYKFDADREWLNAEGYVYCNAVVDVCTQTGVIQRYYGYFFVFHDQDLIGNRLTGQYDFDVSGMDNRLLIGTEITDLDFERARGFRRSAPLAPGDAVDLFSPVPGRYGPEELRGVSPTDIQTFAVFAEDALQINDRLSVITAVRYEELELDRKNFDAAGVQEASGFERDFNWISWRLGSVFKLTDNVVLYAQYSDAKDPVNANIFLVNAGEDFDLTDAEQWEIGLKAVFSEGKAEATLAYYDIERDDVLERIGLDSAGSVGGRESRGIEISATIAANDYWRIGANAAYTDAEFKRSANFVNFAGNTPPNVPELTGNLWSSLRLTGVPIELGAALRFVDDRYGDSANNITLKSYLLLDAYASWTHKNLRVSARISNVTDEDYASWADVFYLQQNDPGFLYANQLLLGSPRTYELSFEASF
ncbi:MAG: TonB-dependent receptor [Pseudomonadaceae bacterium]|nr:TonB-dependent receptor [Pseudomonadaceae bacterium]